MPVAKEQIRQIIADNNISSAADVYTLLKDGFKDIIQELMEAELDATLGYNKNRKGDMDTANKRNVHSPKKFKASMGNSRLTFPKTGTATLIQRLSLGIRGMSLELRKRSARSTAGG